MTLNEVRVCQQRILPTLVTSRKQNGTYRHSILAWSVFLYTGLAVCSNLVQEAFADPINSSC